MTRTAGALALLAGCLLITRPAAAEVTLVKSDPWEIYTSGRVNAFYGWAFGDGKPEGQLRGGGVDTTTDKIPKIDPATGLPDPMDAGTVSKMRIHSGFVPNVLSMGARRKISGDTTLKAQFSLWGTLETAGQRKFMPVTADFREGFFEAEGPWGTFTAGRFGSLFSRGITQTNYLYLHAYGVGFWGGGGTYNPGPTAGLIGFGVLANSFSPGLMYTTPNMSGFSAALGVFDPVNMPGSWESTRTPRPEAELMYDIGSGNDPFKLHVYVNGAVQKVYNLGQTKDYTIRGIAGGFRVEFGGLHIGAGGHHGKGLGLYYALEGSEADTLGGGEPFRTADGFSVFVQYSLPQLDLNAGFGQSRIHLLAQDSLPENAMVHPIKTQTGIAAAIVYHVNESLHIDLDYLRGMFSWYTGGGEQNINYLNAGVTLTW